MRRRREVGKWDVGCYRRFFFVFFKFIENFIRFFRFIMFM